MAVIEEILYIGLTCAGRLRQYVVADDIRRLICARSFNEYLRITRQILRINEVCCAYAIDCLCDSIPIRVVLVLGDGVPRGSAIAACLNNVQAILEIVFVRDRFGSDPIESRRCRFNFYILHATQCSLFIFQLVKERQFIGLNPSHFPKQNASNQYSVLVLLFGHIVRLRLIWKDVLRNLDNPVSKVTVAHARFN